MFYFLEMIPINETVDYAWSEFERYSTNDYIRRLLDVQTTTLVTSVETEVA